MFYICRSAGEVIGTKITFQSTFGVLWGEVIKIAQEGKNFSLLENCSVYWVGRGVNIDFYTMVRIADKFGILKGKTVIQPKGTISDDLLFQEIKEIKKNLGKKLNKKFLREEFFARMK